MAETTAAAATGTIKRENDDLPEQGSGPKKARSTPAVHRPNVGSTSFEFGYHLRPYPWELNSLPPPGKLWESRAKEGGLVWYEPAYKKSILSNSMPMEEDVPFYYLRTNENVWHIPVQLLSQGGQGVIVLYRELWGLPNSRILPSTEPVTRYVGKLNYRSGEFFKELSAAFDDGEYMGGDDDEIPVDFSETFRDEVMANELMRMTGTSHTVRTIGFPKHSDSYFLMEHIEDGTLADYRGPWTLVDVWHLFECLVKAAAVMAWGSEYPDFRIKGWQQIIHLDLVPENVFVGRSGDPYHSCGSHRCFKVGDYGYNILWPVGDVVTNPFEDPTAPGMVNHHRKEMVDIESKDRRYTGRGRARPPEQTHAIQKLNAKGDHKIAHNYSWWTNVWQIGKIIQGLDLSPIEGTTKAATGPGLSEKLDGDPTAGTPGHKTPLELSALTHMARTAYWRAASRPTGAGAGATEASESLSLARLRRLVDACTMPAPQSRVDISNILIEVTRGLGEAGAYSDPRWREPPVVQWEADAQDRFIGLAQGRVEEDRAKSKLLPPVVAADAVKARAEELRDALQGLLVDGEDEPKLQGQGQRPLHVAAAAAAGASRGL